MQTDTTSTDHSSKKTTLKDKAKNVAKDGAKFAMWYTIAQFALEVLKVVMHR